MYLGYRTIRCGVVLDFLAFFLLWRESGSGGKLAVFWWVRDHYYDRRKKTDTVVCLVGARSLLRPEKKDTVICLAGA